MGSNAALRLDTGTFLIPSTLPCTNPPFLSLLKDVPGLEGGRSFFRSPISPHESPADPSWNLQPYNQDPSSVHKSWAVYFAGLDGGLPSAQAFTPPPGSGGPAPSLNNSHPATLAPTLASGDASDLSDHLKVQLLVRAYQVRGHHTATLDPLGIMEADLSKVRPAELDLSYYGWSEADLSKEVCSMFLSFPRISVEAGADTLSFGSSPSALVFFLALLLPERRR